MSVRLQVALSMVGGRRQALDAAGPAFLRSSAGQLCASSVAINGRVRVAGRPLLAGAATFGALGCTVRRGGGLWRGRTRRVVSTRGEPTVPMAALGHAGLGSVAGYTKITAARRQAAKATIEDAGL